MRGFDRTIRKALQLTIVGDSIEAPFSYQRNLLQLESAVGRAIL